MSRRELRHEAAIRRLVDAYERQLNEAHSHEIEALAAAHQVAHDREHEFTEVAIGKATASISTELAAIRDTSARLAAQHPTFMTIDRFDREHGNIVARQQEDHESLRTLLAQIGTLRALVIFLGLPGLAALGWIVLATVGHVGVTVP